MNRPRIVPAAGLTPVFFLALALALVTLSLAGCANRDEYRAQFVRYATVQGEKVAMVTPAGQGGDTEQQSANTALSDLRPGETVVVRYIGHSWDTPQWTPEREIVRRSSDR